MSLNILVTNDDGISSELLLQLIKIASGFGTVFVAAPDHQCSAMSHHITINSRLTATERVLPFARKSWSVSGTPAFRNNPDNPFAKTEYLLNIVDSFIEGDVAFVIKCIDRICNVYDFIKEGNYKYAKIYFHKADMLWNELYKRKNMYTNLWNEVIKINNSFSKN